MKFLIDELNKYVDIKNYSRKKMFDIFNNLAFEVEDVYPALQISNVKLKKVEDCVKHPNADNLSHLHTKIDDKLVDVICGGKNISKNQIVAHAIPGSKVGKLVMQTKKIRGINSNGMILSLSEIMGLSKEVIEDEEKENIFVFSKKVKLDDDIGEIFGLKGDVFDLSILPDRQYASSYFMMAKEISAFLNKKVNWKIDEVKRLNNDNRAKIQLGEKANSIFVTNAILNENVKTPMWIKKVLYHSGIKPTNTIEDVSAYSMLITGAITYVVDESDEYFLDGQKLNNIDIFKSNALLTKNLKISLVTIGSNITSNFVSEKNVNKIFGSKAIKSTNILSAELTSKFFIYAANKAGFIKNISNTIFKKRENEKKIKLFDEQIFKYLGIEFDLENVNNKLKKLGIIRKNDYYIIPSYRNDINYSADVIEEISRFFGIDNIKPKEIIVKNQDAKFEFHKFALLKIANELIKYGFYEAKTYQLVTKNQAKEHNIWSLDSFTHLKKEYTIEHNTLRTSLLTGLLESLKLNYKKEKEDIRLFEIGNVYLNDKQIYMLGLIHNEKINVDEPINATKELILRVLEELKINMDEITFENNDENNFIFNQYVSAKIKKNGETIGLIGEIHPSILRKNKFIRLDKIKSKLYYAELMIENII